MGITRYVLSSFKFQDVDKNFVALVTDKQIEQSQTLLNSILSQQRTLTKLNKARIRICILISALSMSYAAIVWSLIQPVINSVVFIIAFFVAVISSLMLGKIL
jgi:hypothetical protein